MTSGLVQYMAVEESTSIQWVTEPRGYSHAFYDKHVLPWPLGVVVHHVNKLERKNTRQCYLQHSKPLVL